MAHHWFTLQVWQCSPDVHKQTMDKRGASYTSLFIIKVFVVLLIMYVLSYGPACYLWEQTNWPERFLHHIYAPIVWAQEYTLFKGVIDWYVSLFS